jgi:hypothetical protein
MVMQGKLGERDNLISKSIHYEAKDEEWDIDFFTIKSLACMEDCLR